MDGLGGLHSGWRSQNRSQIQYALSYEVVGEESLLVPDLHLESVDRLQGEYKCLAPEGSAVGHPAHSRLLELAAELQVHIGVLPQSLVTILVRSSVSCVRYASKTLTTRAILQTSYIITSTTLTY